MGFEPTAYCLEGRRSTPELHPHQAKVNRFGASASPLRPHCTLRPTAHLSGRVDLRPAEVPPSAGNHRPLEPTAHLSGRVDLNHRPLEPKSSALTGLRHAPR
jgi:hypothetical protein